MCYLPLDEFQTKEQLFRQWKEIKTIEQKKGETNRGGNQSSIEAHRDQLFFFQLIFYSF